MPEDILRDDGENKGGVEPDPDAGAQKVSDAKNKQGGKGKNKIVEQKRKILASTENPVKDA